MSRPTQCLHYIVGADLAQGMQPTALAVLEQDIRDRNGRAVCAAMRLRHLERMPLDTTLPQAVARIGALLDRVKAEEQARRTDLVVDITGTGRAVVPLLKGAGLKPVTVTITAGAGEVPGEADPNDWRIGKVDLVGNLQVQLQTGMFKVARSLELTDTLVQELQTFKLKPPGLNPNDPESWREGQHDDLVFAAALATWRASRHTPQPRSVGERQNQALEQHRKAMAQAVV